MIITCNNCDKKFDIDSNLIPQKGRLLECGSCKHKWFFKKVIKNNLIETINIDKPIEVKIDKEELLPIKIEASENIELLAEHTQEDLAVEKISIKEDTINKYRNKKSYNVLRLTIVFAISFIALIIILDTFQVSIAKIAPNVEFILYNLYETIKDIGLFLKDLI
tara:strand:+ start:81 stop:572 length:492 start_codon:yes stop_codon:yes gene_type:complete